MLTSVIELTSDELKPPSIWSELTPGATAAPKRQLDGKNKSRKGNSVTKGENREPKMMWDFETEMWVENIMGTDTVGFLSYQVKQDQENLIQTLN